MTLTDWWLWRKCPVCRSPTGRACVSRSGTTAAHVMFVPHKARKRRTVRRRGTPR